MKRLTAALLIFFLNFFAFADDASHFIEAKIILAGKITTSIDTRLTKLAEKFSRYFNYTSYRLVSMEGIELIKREKYKVSLPEKGFLQLKILRETDNGISLKIYNRGGRDFNSIIHLKPGGSVHFISSSVKEGDIIITLTLKDESNTVEADTEMLEKQTKE